MCRIALPELSGKSSDVTNDTVTILKSWSPAQGPVAKDPKAVAVVFVSSLLRSHFCSIETYEHKCFRYFEKTAYLDYLALRRGMCSTAV